MPRNVEIAELFTPAEAEMVTGVNVALQRDWRRRGLLSDRDGAHARYSASELAEMLLMRDFADEKLGPKLLRAVLGTSALPLGDWVSILADACEDASPHALRNGLPDRYVVASGDFIVNSNDLGQTFAALSEREDRRFAFVFDLRKVASRVVASVPRPIWRRDAPEAVV